MSRRITGLDELSGLDIIVVAFFSDVGNKDEFRDWLSKKYSTEILEETISVLECKVKTVIKRDIDSIENEAKKLSNSGYINSTTGKNIREW